MDQITENDVGRAVVGSDQDASRRMAIRAIERLACWSTQISGGLSHIKLISAADIGSDEVERRTNQCLVNGVSKAISPAYNTTFRELATEFVSIEIALNGHPRF